jgi:ligand-binding sensor domain-containing protein
MLMTARMNFFRQYIVLFGIVLSQCCFFYNAEGQQINTAFKHLSTTEGLSNFTVYSIAQDHQGFMWFGTMDGLNRYDGKEIKTYREDPDDQNSLGKNVINALQVSGDSGILVGTYHGLYYYNFHFDNFQHIPLLPNVGTARQYHMIRAFLVVEDHMWIATSLGLFRYDFAMNQVENFSDQLSPQGGNFTSVFALELAEEGTIWLGHAGLSKYKNNEFEHVPIDTEAVVPNSSISLFHFPVPLNEKSSHNQ